MTVLHEIDKRLALLKSADPQGRTLAAAEMGDYLEGDRLSPASLKRVLKSLLHSALAETDSTARESLFNAISTAAECSDTNAFDWSPMIARLDELPVDCLEHALVVLGFSGNPKYRTIIKSLLSHPDESIRAGATEALSLLAGEADAALKSAQRRT